ncbi:dihydrofolate reductase family protein [Xenorhabdus griffiniae]|uniref:Dihydrofolate reductase family protein n=2 Tax=Xenorhabdus griffiniae TaxID=351672 RepID=A0ABY9XIG6_9GAMM|nr:dihydrofolate reductase family protein [Xenorhabdus griffiniae]WMV72593.1 dihydrofolate reductase family protein [Xenorhabdus griffiniae]WNH02272.1 dihydrofolate reductase family protein [Xenorhabdus griffiniae]
MMSKLIYYVAATMDGYIATENHELDWLYEFTLGDDATPYDDFYRGIGAAIMGAETYEWIMKNSADDWPYRDIPSFILSSRKLSVPVGINAVVTQESPKSIASKARLAAKGKDVWVVGGGKTAACFANAGELEQLFITTIPVFLGSGVHVLPIDQKTKVVPKMQRLLQSGAIETLMDVKMS